MKKLLALITIALVLSSCSHDKDIVLNGKEKTFESYGWANADQLKNDSIQYSVSTGNVVWSVILCETVFMPVWLTGWDLYNPIAVKAQYRDLLIKEEIIGHYNKWVTLRSDSLPYRQLTNLLLVKYEKILNQMYIDTERRKMIQKLAKITSD